MCYPRLSEVFAQETSNILPKYCLTTPNRRRAYLANRFNLENKEVPREQCGRWIGSERYWEIDVNGHSESVLATLWSLIPSPITERTPNIEH